ncbi:MAG: hypothetical protein ACREAE_08495, partial [Nitrosopumilaceae archaeon]
DNFRHYEDFDNFLEFVEEKLDVDLEEYVKTKFTVSDDTANRIITNVRNNLSEGNFTFFVIMDELNDDLKTQINYLNTKTDGTFAIYAVEIENYVHDDYTIVVPKLFGFEIKEGTSKSYDKNSKTWIGSDHEFLELARGKIRNEKDFEAFKKLYEGFCLKVSDGKQYREDKDGSVKFLPKFYKFSETKSPFYLTDDGKLRLQISWFEEHGEQTEMPIMKEFRKKLAETNKIFEVKSGKKNVSLEVEKWAPAVDEFIDVVKKFVN